MATPRIRKRTTGKGGLKVNFQNVLEAIRKDMHSHMADAVRSGFQQIVEETPRDTGYAQSNWRVLFANVKIGEISKKDKDQEYPSVDFVMAREEEKFKFISKRGFDMGFRFQNETPYIYELEMSHKSKSKFVLRGITKMRIELEKSMKKRSKAKGIK